ncbi:DMT family transporter [Acinetobacter sp. HY1485]|uniref:DMT family transporter n=1 Tax=Acinetobacter sp. HY1485 TaxID=2970918 RepID=UPI0022B99C77|nr:DMT family transporter [Acinetobacter sp. HY1485]
MVQLLPIFAVFIWALNIVVTRYVAEFVSPVSISFYRWLIAFLLLTPFIFKKVIQQSPQIKQYLPQLAVLSAFGMVLYQGLAYTASHYTTATNMGLINAFIPVFTILVSLIVLKEKPTIFAIVGGVLSFLGLLYVLSQGHMSNLISHGSFLGNALMLVGVFFYAFYGVFLKKWKIQLPLLLSLYVQIIFALIYHLPLIYWFGLDHINSQNASSILYAGIFPSLIAPFLWMKSVSFIGPNRTSIFMNLMPVFTAVIATFWLSESWTIFHTVGGLIILGGIILAQKKQ